MRFKKRKGRKDPPPLGFIGVGVPIGVASTEALDIGELLEMPPYRFRVAAAITEHEYRQIISINTHLHGIPGTFDLPRESPVEGSPAARPTPDQKYFYRAYRDLYYGSRRQKTLPAVD